MANKCTHTLIGSDEQRIKCENQGPYFLVSYAGDGLFIACSDHLIGMIMDLPMHEVVVAKYY